MNLVRACIERPVAAAVIAILVVLAGLVSLAQAPVQLSPEIAPTVVSVVTYWDGASPAEIESDIVLEQEERLRSVADLVKMSSVSQQNTGSIALEFKVGVPKEVALREVSDKLREVPSYPENVDEPVVTAGDDRSRDYIAWIIVRSGDPNFDVRDAFDFFDDRVKPYLERAKGVSEVRVLGGREREAQVLVDADALAARGVAFSELFRVLRAENFDASAGRLPEGKRDIRLRVVGRFETPEQILDTVISVDESGAPVLVRDVADVRISLAEPTSFVRSKGESVMAINVQREVGSNVLGVMGELKARIAELNGPGGMLEQEARRLGLTAPFFLDQVYDQTIYIENALDLVVSNIYVGGALAVLCLLLFLRNFRATLIVAATIPVSVIGSFIVLPALGRNINVISLAGMAFAVGMVVDNAIVVLENIYRRREMGEPALLAAYHGAREVWVAILISTLTTVVVFVPILTVQEEVGQLFRDIALAICAAVLLSLAAAVIIIPPAAARLLRDSGRPKKQRTPGPISRALHAPTRVLSGFRDGFARVLEWSLGSWLVRLGVVTAITVISLGGAVLLAPPASYLPPGNRNLIFGFLIPPPGYNMEKQTELGMRMEEVLRPFWEADLGSPEAAALPEVPAYNPETGQVSMIQPPPIQNFFFVAFGEAMFMGADSKDETRVQPLVPLLSHAASQERLPGVFAIPFQAPLFNVGGGFGAGNSIELEITGDDLDEVRRAATVIMTRAFELQGQGLFESVRPDPGNFNIASQEVRLRIDPVRARQNGMTASELGAVIRALGDGAVIGDFRLGGENIDLRVMEKRQADWRSPELDLQTVARVPIATPLGAVVEAGSVAVATRTDSPQQINRIEGRRSVTLTLAPPTGVALESAMDAVRNDIIRPLRESGAVPPTIQTDLAGAADKLTQVRRAMLGSPQDTVLGTIGSILSSRLVLALLCCYLLMCALFESWVYPLVILVSVPLAMVGGMIGLRIVHSFDPTQQLDTLSMLGFIILIGVVVNNAILLVAQALNFMRGFGESEEDVVEKLSPRKAIAESARTRLRPILMSTMTSVLGMAPLVLKPGAGSELYRGLGAVVVGGLLCSAVFTLIVCPMLLSLAIDLRRMVAKMFGRDWDPAHVDRLTVGRRRDPAHVAPAAGDHMAAHANSTVEKRPAPEPVGSRA